MEGGVVEGEGVEGGRTADLTSAARISCSEGSSLSGSDCMPKLCLSLWVVYVLR